MLGNQKTIKSEVRCFGIGLHSGETVNLALKPAGVNQGIVFQRIARDGTIIGRVNASYLNVSNTQLCTTISSNDGKIRIATVEHLMAALWGCGIDNVLVELDGDEVPIMDGSSDQFVFIIECAGTIEQSASRNVIEVLKEVTVHEGEAFARISPSDNFLVSVEIDFADKVISKQKFVFNSDESSFKLDLCRARTFGFVQDVEKLRSMGLAKGGSLDNVVVVAEDGILNENGLRFSNEFVRHKVLDSIGDLYLSGVRILASFYGVKSGHSLNNKLLRTLFADEQAWRLIQLPGGIAA